nr:ribonuclease H-like domain-containing protein [Tanacetum cinerariifolium]
VTRTSGGDNPKTSKIIFQAHLTGSNPTVHSETVPSTIVLKISTINQIEGLISEFMTSQDARLSKFESDFKQQQSEMTKKVDTVLKAITDRMAGTLPNDTVKNPKLGTHPVSSARSYPTVKS